MADTDDTATLRYPGGEIDLQIVHATEGADGIALGPLLAKTGHTTFDVGFANTAAAKSSITYIDGDAGILRYRGYPIDQLAEKSTFIEVCYLLIYGELPDTDQLAQFTGRIQRHTMLHEDLKRFFDGFPRNAHPMPVLSSVVNALSAYYQDALDPMDNGQVELSTIRLLAKLPTIAAYAYKKSVGQPFLYPDNSLTLVENFLRLTFGFPAEPYQADPEVVRALDMLFILHADHEQNCSSRRFGWLARREPTCSPRSRVASTHYGVRFMAAPIRLSWRCSRAFATAATTSASLYARSRTARPGSN